MPLFIVIFASPNAPYIENLGLAPTSVLYGSAPPDSDKPILESYDKNWPKSRLNIMLSN